MSEGSQSRSTGSNHLYDAEEGFIGTPIAGLRRQEDQDPHTGVSRSPDTSIPQTPSSLGVDDNAGSSVASRERRSILEELDFEREISLRSPSIVKSSVHRSLDMESEDLVAEALKGYFVDDIALPEQDFVKQQVVIKKEDRGKPGTKEYACSHNMITTAL